MTYPSLTEMRAAEIRMLAPQAAQGAFPSACSWEQPCRDTACQCGAQRSAVLVLPAPGAQGGHCHSHRHSGKDFPFSAFRA